MIAIFVSGCGQINSDEVGFKTSFGRIDSPILGPGLYGVNPIGGYLYKYSVRDTRFDITTPAYTKDMPQAIFQVSVIFAIDRSRVIDLHTKYGKNMQIPLSHQKRLRLLKTLSELGTQKSLAMDENLQQRLYMIS